MGALDPSSENLTCEEAIRDRRRDFERARNVVFYRVPHPTTLASVRRQRPAIATSRVLRGRGAW